MHTYVDSLPYGFRWATEDETERWPTLPVIAYVQVAGTDQRDLAVPEEDGPDPADREPSPEQERAWDLREDDLRGHFFDDGMEY